MNGELPPGWAMSPLASIAAINPRHPRSLKDSTDVSFAPMAAISESKPGFEFLWERPLGKVRQGFTHFSEGDVLFAKITPCMENGKGAVARGLRNGVGCGTTELIVIRPLGGIDSDYVYRFLSQSSVRAEAKENFTGTAGQARVPTSFIEELQLPLAPVTEQRRIVAKLDELVASADTSRERLKGIALILKRFRQSVLAAACSGRLTADWRSAATEEALSAHVPVNPRAAAAVDHIVDTPEGWRWFPLQALCDPTRAVCYGVIKLGPEISNGIPCLRTSDVKPLRVETSAVKRISKEVSEQYRRTLLRGGEVLVNVRGTLGGVAVVDPALRDWNISREVALIPVAKVSSHFISLWIASLPCQNWLTGVTRGVAYTGINIEDLRMLPVALPSDAEQVEIVQRVEALFSLAERIESRLEETEKTVYDLIPSVLARAFRGELVPTEAELAKGDGRDYESASALLDRIWAERGPQTFGADAGDGGEAAGHRRPRRG